VTILIPGSDPRSLRLFRPEDGTEKKVVARFGMPEIWVEIRRQSTELEHISRGRGYPSNPSAQTGPTTRTGNLNKSLQQETKLGRNKRGRKELVGGSQKDSVFGGFTTLQGEEAK